MSRQPSPCLAIEPDLVAAAAGEADAHTARRVADHVAACSPCRASFERYRALDDAVSRWSRGPLPADALDAARARLDSRLADLRRRMVWYGIFPSPLGRLLIARTEEGVSLVEYLGAGRGLAGSRLARVAGVEPHEDTQAIEALYRELLDYVEGRRTRLEWPLDLRLARSDFHRRVLAATAGIPYGGVASYVGVAHQIGAPAAVRAVAQALRRNPLPIVVPCHRVIGASGALTGYAGDKIDLKRRLLALEGVPAERTGGTVRVPTQGMYLLTPGEVEYCVPTCPGLHGTTDRQRLIRIASRQRAEAGGLAPCTTCRPDLHPLEP
jgi:O-6-methylguanine DNA methyltransferase